MMEGSPTMRQFIQRVVTEFYSIATVDTLIGYQFRKIAEFQSENVLRPPIEAFSAHIPRISAFWELQLTGKMGMPVSPPFDLIETHRLLNIRRGEVGRWMNLFNETLKKIESEDLSDQERKLISIWREKLLHFEKKFLKSPRLFNQSSL